ncbi:MAG TPA: hypothetical protein VFY93_16820 [Planctomycetota bacterium]|nr:hypothetical protein [Planctomycetota bacterium]
MAERKDPMLPLLATAVSLVLIASVFHFYPRVSRWLGPSVDAVVGDHEAGDVAVPVWVCRGVDGVGLILSADGHTQGLDDAFVGGPYHLLTLHVYNFAREAPFDLTLPEKGFLSPEGGEPALPAARFVPADAPAALRPVLLALGAVPALHVERGRAGKALLAVRSDPAGRTAFVAGPLIFERRELERTTLARFEQRPDRKQFEEF